MNLFSVILESALAALFYSSPLHADVAGLYKDFGKLCEAHLSDNEKKKDICDCLTRNFRIKKLSESQLKIIKLSYEDNLPKKLSADDSAALDFEENLASECMANPKKELSPAEE